MVSNQHLITLYINKQLVELESQESLNLRMNNVLFNPTKTTTTQASYSYSFDIPATERNNKILDYANNLSKLNKFHARYPAQVYADGELIFNGSLTIQKYSAKDGKYTCNLVSIKTNTLDEIFGDETLTSLKWMVDFDGAPTINQVNNDMNSGYFFPLACYGAFQKNYVTADSVGATYTPKSAIDSYNKWWVESFYPSLNVVETLRKAFESKGYTVGGSAFSDINIKNIYASCNLAQEQMPIYNLGNQKFGKIDIDLTWNNYNSQGEREHGSGGGVFGRGRTEYTHASSTGGLSQDLKFPYEAIYPAANAINNNASAEYNLSTITFWNMMDSVNNPSGVSVSVNSNTYMYDPNEMLIVIPADGWYKINLSCNARLSGAGQSVTVSQWTNTFYQNDEMTKRDVTLGSSHTTFNSYFPLEIQLIKNYDENIELIKGKKNVIYHTGDPNQSEYHYEGGSYTSTSVANKEEWLTEFPHQDSFGAMLPTKDNSIMISTSTSRAELLAQLGVTSETSSGTNAGGSFGTRRAGIFGNGDNMGGNSGSGQEGGTQSNNFGFIHQDGQVMPYDPAVSPAFICGFSTMGGGQASVARNGRSWSNLSSISNKVLCNVGGLDLYLRNSSGGTDVHHTNYCKNTYNQAPNATFSMTNNTMQGTISCCVYLQKNDRLELVAIQRDFEKQVYSTSASCHIDITAMSERTETELRADSSWGYYSGTEFPTKLNLFNFTNSETKISDWITSVQKAFNLEITQTANNIEIDTNKGVKKDLSYAVDIDDRVNSNEVEAEFISYPKSMAVKYKINTDEYGFELTIPQEHINDEGDEWRKWGDSGFTVIELNDDSYETQKQETQTNFSYTYYMNFDFTQQYSSTAQTAQTKTIRIPVIELSEYMAEGYNYDEAMAHDGYSFAQRFWYRQAPSSDYVWLSSILSNGTHETVTLTYPMNSYNGFNLSYKNSEKSIATEYFNISPMLASNYVNVEVYITPVEYKAIKDGALIHFDDDLYYVSEIKGYDASGFNPTTLKLIKKV